MVLARKPLARWPGHLDPCSRLGAWRLVVGWLFQSLLSQERGLWALGCSWSNQITMIHTDPSGQLAVVRGVGWVGREWGSLGLPGVSQGEGVAYQRRPVLP